MLRSFPVLAATEPARAPLDISVGSVILVGILIVFAVLTIIFLVMTLLERIFRSRGRKSSVRCPFDGVLDKIVATGSVEKDAVAAIATDSEGRRNEILSPIAGQVTFVIHEGDAFKQGDTLFTVEKEAAKS